MSHPDTLSERRRVLPLLRFLEDAFENICASRQRSSLALLGIVIGTACVIAMINTGQNATEESTRQFKAMGIDIVVAQSTGSSSGTGLPIASMDALALPSVLTSVKSSAPLIVTSGNASFHGKGIDTAIVGATASLNRTARLSMRSGRFISNFDHYETFAVLGCDVAKALGSKDHPIGLGDKIRIGDYLFTVVGLLAEVVPNPLIPVEFNNAIVIPLESMRRVSLSTDVSTVIMRLAEEVNPVAASDAIRIYFESKMGDTLVQVQSARLLIEGMQAQHRLFSYLLMGMGAISLLVGGIGVMNVMLTGVLERRSEIGLRMAIGARQKDILTIFIMEAGVLSMVGGIVGTLLGFVIAYLIAYISEWQFVFDISALPIGIGMSIAVGLISGIYPAMAAARLHPIVALRSE